MHLPEPSMGSENANLIHSSSLMTSVPHDPRHAVPALLFQPVWRAEHLRLLKVKEKRQIAAEAIVGRFHLPKDGRDDFEELATELCEATNEEIVAFTATKDKFHHNMFWPVFSELSEMSSFSSGCISQSRYVRSAKTMVRSLVDTILPYVDDEGSLRLELNSVPFYLQKAGVKGILACDGCIIKMDLMGRVSPLPVVALAVVRPNEHEDVEAQEASQLVLQAALAHEQDPTLNSYKAFAIHVEGTRLQVVSADISRTYLENLYRVSCPEGFDVLHSAAYDMLDIDGRREALRIISGLLKSLRAKPARRPF